MSELTIYSAFDQSKIGTLPILSESEALKKLDNAYALFKNKKEWLPLVDRISILKKAQQLVSQRRESLALEAAKEGGKPLADSLVEIDRAADGIGVAIKEVSSLHGTEIPMNLTASSQGRHAYTRREPRGVAIAVSAFNHPFNLIVHQVIPAIAAGCPVIVLSLIHI